MGLWKSLGDAFGEKIEGIAALFTLMGGAAIFALSSLLHYSVRVHFPKGFRDVSNSAKREGLKVARLMMVLSSISPLFLLWAIRGSKLLPDRYLVRMQGAPPPNGWFVRYVSGMEGKQDINRGD
jgi:hypothetical protein